SAQRDGPWASGFTLDFASMSHSSPAPPGAPDDTLISIVAPAHNEQDNVRALVEEVEKVFTENRPGRFELIIVDDGSVDATRARVVGLMTGRPWLRCVAMTKTPPGKGGGQSAAMWAGIHESRGGFVATLDADLQNSPADLPAMLELLEKT